MTRMLIIEDDVPAADLTRRRLESAGFTFAWERVQSEADFRDALTREPDIILSDSQVDGFSGMAALEIAQRERPETPFIFVSGDAEERSVSHALDAGASGFVSKADVTGLASTVRIALQRVQKASGAREKRRSGFSAGDASGIAESLLERRNVLDRTLRQQDRSAMSTIMRRTPPAPVALVMIDDARVQERFVKLLGNANIEISAVDSIANALVELERHVQAVLFTNRVELVRAARQLYAGAATHVVFVNQLGAEGASEALRAGANDVMPDEPRGDEFWAHLTTARRIVSLAASLQLALLDNRVLSTVDELTGCGSRRFFEQEFPREVERAVRLARPLVVILSDIDYFKAINDGYGHQIGDEILSEFGKRLNDGLRRGHDWVARVGGEEFAVVLPDTRIEEGAHIAERLRERMASERFPTASGAVELTASFGVSGLAFARGQRPASMKPDGLIKAADAALYRSKNNGRNCVTVGEGDIGCA
jgi:two-component system cell cycle response regulator